MRSSVEPVLLLSLVALAGLAVFGSRITTHAPEMSLAFLMLPLVAWTAVRLGLHGATLALLVVVGIADVATARGVGPFAGPSVDRSLLLLQVFVGTVSGTTLLLAAALRERRSAEWAVAQSERRWHSVFEHSPIPFWEEDFSAVREAFDELRAAGVEALENYLARFPGEIVRLARLVRVVEVSRSALALVGARSLEELNDPVVRFFEEDAYPVFARELGALWRGERSFEAEIPLHDGAGRRRLFALRMLVVPGCEQTLSRVLVSTLDLTERREAELALREAHQRKDEFLAVLSHELRNPLAPIQNSLFVIERAPGSERAARALTIAKRQVQHLARLVDDLLDVTRVMRGKVQLRLERLDLTETVSRSVEDRQASFVERGLALEVDLPREPLWLEGDPTRLAQVVGNLLHNAAKFTPSGGRVRVVLQREGAAAVLRVSDTGTGLPEEMLERIFEPFTQAKQALDHRLGGLGLGLALVKGLVELHQGEVRAASAGPGRGAEFTVRLPLGSQAPLLAEPTTSQAEVRPANARRRVLVIEDNVDAAESLRDAVEQMGHEVRIAYDGAEGLAMARAFRPDMVLCDIGLPGMNGYEVAQAFRADETLRHSRLVALTGYAQPEDRKKASEAGFDGHLAKPPNLDLIEKLVASAAS